MDLLQQGANWLEAQRHKHLSHAVTYCRGDQSLQIQASVGKTAFELDDGAGAVLRIETRDYLIRTQDLTLGLPQRGDLILETIGGQVITYEVSAPGNYPHYRFSDPQRLTLRLHSQQVEAS